MPKTQIGWISTVRYQQPLSATDEKKWQLLTEGLSADIYVMAFSATLRPRRFQQHAHFYLLPLLPFAPLRYGLVFLWAPFMAWWFIFRHGVDVLVAQSPYEGAVGAFAIWVACGFGKRVALAVEAHNDYENNLFTLKKVSWAGLYRRVMAIVSRYGIQRANALRAVSQSTQAQLSKMAPQTPIVRFMTWTDISAFDTVRRTVALVDALTVVYVGVITQLKGIHFLLEAFAQQDERFRLVLIGAEEQPSYAQALREHITRLGLEERVQWCGKLPQAQLALQLVNARALVLPSQSEGLPRVIIEAMTCGTPVIATRVGGIPEILRDGDNGYLIPPADVPALAHALQTVLNMEQAPLEQLVQRAQQTARDTFSTQVYLDGYRQLVALAQATPHA